MVLFSCVRARQPGSSGGVGFLADVRRMNVGLTRGRCAGSVALCCCVLSVAGLRLGLSVWGWQGQGCRGHASAAVLLYAHEQEQWQLHACWHESAGRVDSLCCRMTTGSHLC